MRPPFRGGSNNPTPGPASHNPRPRSYGETRLARTVADNWKEAVM